MEHVSIKIHIELKETFSQFGYVKSIKIIKDPITRESRGFGFIEMEEDDAQQAIKELDGHTINGNTISVNKARKED